MSLELLLIVVSVVSVLLCAAMAVVLVRWRREERLRSDARVALLRDLATDDEDLVLRSDAISDGEQPAIFQVEPQPTPWFRRIAAAAAVLVLLTAGIWGWSVIPRRSPAASAPKDPVATTLPLELMSLSHAQEADSFTVTGLVQNPAGSLQLNRVEATVLLFDNRGTMLTSGRAPLDFTALAAGDESPFVIRVPVSRAVARYRVGFRSMNGEVLGHVDRRNLDSIAQRQAP